MVAGMTDRAPFIDRDHERRELRALLEAGAPRLALLTGRRRIGKTYLLAHTWPHEVTFHFTAARTTPEINRRQLLDDLARWSGEPIEPDDYPTWRSVFRLLLEIRAPEPLVVVIDEFPYLASDEAGLAEVASELNAVWERRRDDRPMVLALSGSAVATMEALAAGGSPLYGRFDWQGMLQPFDALFTARAAPFPDLADAVRTYAVFGGVPRYLAAIDPTQPFEDESTRLHLAPRGEVRQLVATALDQEEGLRDVASYKAVLRAVAAGQTERNEIAQRTGLKNDTGLRARLDRLVALGYLEAHRNIDARPNSPYRYRVADAAVRFHQRFVEPNLSLLERGDPKRIWQEMVRPHLATFVGQAFERVAAEAYDRLSAGRDLPLVREWGRFEGRDRAGVSLEVDLVAHLANGAILSGAVKWNRKPVGPRLHRDHLSMLQRAADAGRRWAHLALAPDALLVYVAAGGFTDAFRAAIADEERRVVAWTLEDLYAEP